MRQTSNNLLDRYQPWRRLIEPGIFILFYCVQALINSWISWTDLARHGNPLNFREPAVWEFSSNLSILALIPLLLAFERRFPLRLNLLGKHLPWHFLATVFFCLAHVCLMVGMRKLAYFSQGVSYDFGNWWHELIYEYLKDFRTYFALIIIVSFYRLILLRWQGEASLLEEPDQGLAVEEIERPERFLVRKLGKDFLLPAAEIEWLQAWGNYVNLHVREHDYPLRSTMAAIEQRLDPTRFVRVHRSYILNLDFLLTLEPLESGDARALLRGGGQVPVSRRYRDELKKIVEM